VSSTAWGRLGSGSVGVGDNDKFKLCVNNEDVSSSRDARKTAERFVPRGDPFCVPRLRCQVTTSDVSRYHCYSLDFVRAAVNFVLVGHS